MGLVCDPNASALEEIKREKAKLLSLNGICLHESDEGEELPQGREESRVVQLLKEIANEPPAPPRIQTSLAIWEQVELQKLVAKHGEDYEAMARDMKLNKYQRNANQLRKRVALFHHLQNL
jgi:nucleolar protein 16